MSQPVAVSRLAVGLILLTTLAFVPVCTADFINLDDPTYVTDNPGVKAGLSPAGLRWAWTTAHAGFWQPITWMSLQADYQLCGLQPWGYHLTNLLLHIANALLVFALLRRMTGAVWPSFFVAVLFAVHPLRVESVAWITERKDVLSTFFGLLALGAYVCYAERPSLSRYLAIVLFFVLGLLSKPMLVTLPCLLLLLDWWPLRRLRAGPPPLDTDPPFATASLFRLLAEKLPLFALAGADAVLTVWAQGLGNGVVSLAELPLGVRAGNALTSYALYLRKTVWPSDLAVLYPYSREGVPGWQVALSGVVLIALTVLAVREARRRPYLTVGWFWFLGSLVPVIGLVQSGPQPMADRFTYLPHIGLLLAVVWGGAELLALPSLAPRVRPIVALSLPAVLGVLTFFQTWYWQDSISLWEHTAQVTEANDAAHENLGGLLLKNGRLDESIEQSRQAVRMNPKNVWAQYNLGVALAHKGELDEAISHLETAVELKPEYAEAHFNLGTVRLQQRKFEDAAPHFIRAIQVRPDYARAHRSLGLLRREQGQLEEAAAHLATAVQYAPDDAETHDALGTVLLRLGRSAEAVQSHRQAASLQPRVIEYRINLANALFHHGEPSAAQAEYVRALESDPGWPNRFAHAARVLAACPDARIRNGVQAVHLAEQVCRATGDRSPEYLDTLSAAYAEAGRFAEAESAARKAIARANDQRRPPEYTRALRERLALYQNRQPYREQPPSR